MHIISFIKKVCVQTAVYWGSPNENGSGGKIYADPVEIKCRWEDKVQLVTELGTTKTGEAVISKAEVLVTQELDYQGYLYLGTLDELYDSATSSGVYLNPKEIDGACEIISRDKIPLFRSSTKFVHKVYLK